MNQQKPKTLSTIILMLVFNTIIIVIGLYYYVKSSMWEILLILIISLILFGYVIYAYVKEKKSDRQADQNIRQYVDGSYFFTPQWRESYLQYKQEHPFRKPKMPSMKADLHRRFMTKDSICFILLGCIFLVASILPIQFKLNYRIICIIAGLFMIFIGTYFMSGQHIRHFFKRTDLNFEHLENSYRSGKMLSYLKNGVNLGIPYVIAYTPQEVFCIENCDIDFMTRELVRLKKYVDGVYTGEIILHRLYIQAKATGSQKSMFIRLELNEFQVEMVLEEFSRLHYVSNLMPIMTTEEVDNQITVG